MNKLRLYHGVRVVTCPDNTQPAAVRVATFGGHLRSCSRWPEMAGCDEACLAEVEAGPDGCTVQAIVTTWYDGTVCHFCTKPIGEIVWHERPPAVLTDGVTREWKDVAPEELPMLFAKGKPVCWPCHIVETFRRENPGKVVERVRLAPVKEVLKPSANVY